MALPASAQPPSLEDLISAEKSDTLAARITHFLVENRFGELAELGAKLRESNLDAFQQFMTIMNAPQLKPIWERALLAEKGYRVSEIAVPLYEHNLNDEQNFPESLNKHKPTERTPFEILCGFYFYTKQFCLLSLVNCLTDLKRLIQDDKFDAATTRLRKILKCQVQDHQNIADLMKFNSQSISAGDIDLLLRCYFTLLAICRTDLEMGEKFGDFKCAENLQHFDKFEINILLYQGITDGEKIGKLFKRLSKRAVCHSKIHGLIGELLLADTFEQAVKITQARKTPEGYYAPTYASPKQALREECIAYKQQAALIFLRYMEYANHFNNIAKNASPLCSFEGNGTIFELNERDFLSLVNSRYAEEIISAPGPNGFRKSILQAAKQSLLKETTTPLKLTMAR